MNKFNLIKTVLIFFILVLVSPSCGIYSFTGTSLSPDIKTIAIQNFFNNSGGGPPNLGQLFTEKMKDYFQRNTSLAIAKGGDGSADLKMEGSVVSYALSPIAPTASTASNPVASTSLTRLTITIKAKFENTKDPSANFDQNFPFFADFDASKSLQAVEAELVDQITDQIVFDIFNKSVANW